MSTWVVWANSSLTHESFCPFFLSSSRPQVASLDTSPRTIRNDVLCVCRCVRAVLNSAGEAGDGANPNPNLAPTLKGQIPLGELVGKLVGNPGWQLVRACTEQVEN